MVKLLMESRNCLSIAGRNNIHHTFFGGYLVSYLKGKGSFYLRVKRLEREANHLFPTTAKVYLRLSCLFSQIFQFSLSPSRMNYQRLLNEPQKGFITLFTITNYVKN
jgi:hypothetical protein